VQRVTPVNQKFEPQPVALQRHFFRRWQNVFALILVLFFVLVALAADVLAPNQDIFWPSDLQWADDPLGALPHPPNRQTLLGTVVARMHRQVDIYTVLVHGTRSAFRFSLMVVLPTAFIGILVGALSAFFGGVLNMAVLRVIDALMALPVIVGVFFINQLLLYSKGDASVIPTIGVIRHAPIAPWLSSLLERVDPVMLALVLFSWMPYARLTNTMVLRTRQTDYVEAARALGANSGRLLWNHVLPNSISPTIILLARDLGGMVVLQATLTFIGLGGGSDWGWVLAISRNWMVGTFADLVAHWWLFLPPILALVMFGVSWNLLGDGLNDWLNPRGA